MTVPKRICVFCSSSNRIDPEYFDEARELGREIGRRGHSLIYGGGDIGTMGALAHAVQRSGGKVVGVIPHALNEMKGVGYPGADELIVTETMRERKAVMEENSDAFIALPGGLGTFEELFEIITLKQLHYHTKAIVILNSTSYFDPLLELFQHAVTGRFVEPQTLEIVHVSTSVSDALDYFETYQPKAALKKYVEEAGLE